MTFKDACGHYSCTWRRDGVQSAFTEIAELLYIVSLLYTALTHIWAFDGVNLYSQQ